MGVPRFAVALVLHCVLQTEQTESFSFDHSIGYSTGGKHCYVRGDLIRSIYNPAVDLDNGRHPGSREQFYGPGGNAVPSKYFGWKGRPGSPGWKYWVTSNLAHKLIPK